MIDTDFKFPTPAAVCEKFACLPEVKALALETPDPSAFISKLRQENLSSEAVQTLGYSLPKEKAVDWAVQSARMAGEKVGLSPEEETALTAAEAWIADPSEANIMDAANAAADLPTSSPAGCSAQAAAFSNGVEMPEGETPLDISNDLTAHYVISAVLLAAALMGPNGLPEIPEIPQAIAGLMDAVLEPENLLEQAIEQLPAAIQPPDMTPEQLAEAAKYLEPFIKIGIEIAKSVSGWS